METAKVFINGRSEAVRLPKNCRFSSREVYIKKVGDIVLLFPKNKTWEVFMKGLKGFSDDFMDARSGQKLQPRPGL